MNISGLLLKQKMLINYRGFSLLFFSLLSLTLFGQQQQQQDFGSIKGKIIDNDSKQAIAGALVILSTTQNTVYSDSLGFFEIKQVNPGNYAIEIRLIGYENQLLTDINVLPNKSTYREINLQEALQTILKGVEINAFKYENNRVAPISSYSFSREEIALNPGSQGDIFRAIGMLPGVSSSGGIYSAIAVRGQ
ncbi:MAG: carboxypeptidase-like regulatory domain-containing protein, partial [Bacteroidia bacterium]